MQPFAGPMWSYPKGTVQSALEPRELKQLACIARCDVSQLGLASTDLSDWLGKALIFRLRLCEPIFLGHGDSISAASSFTYFP